MPDANEGFNTGNPAGYMVGAIQEGWSASEALSTFRADGGAMGEQTWFRLFGEVTDALARSGGAAALDPYELPNPADYATWSMGDGGRYATQVSVFFRDADTGIVGAAPYTYVTDDPHTPDEAMAAAWDEFTAGDNEAKYEQVALGAAVSNVYQTVSWPG